MTRASPDLTCRTAPSKPACCAPQTGPPGSRFVSERIGRPDYPRRSNAAEILVQGAEATAVVISLLQGPVTIAQIRSALNRWGKTRPAKDALIIKGPGVDLRIDDVHSTEGAQAAATAILDLITSQTRPKATSDDGENFVP